MVNEDIITALKNSIEYGDSLESAKKIIINSGYNPQEVEEAAKFIGGGVINIHQPQPGEQLTMPTQKRRGIFRRKQTPQARLTKQIPQQIPSIQQPSAQPLQQHPVSAKQLKQEITLERTTPRTIQQVNQQPLISKTISLPPLNPQQPLQQQLKKIKPKKPGHFKEIMLLLILLALIGVLVVTIVMKDTILGWFSG